MLNYYKYQNGNIAFRIKGEGACIVLLHGFMESMTIWDELSDFLSQYYKVLTIDLPGFGNSDSFYETHEMEFMAEIVHDVLTEIEINECILAGHSMGGYIALAFAEKYPEMLKGLVIFHSHAKADSEEAKINRERAIKIIEADKGSFVAGFIPDLFAEENVRLHSERIKAMIKEAEGIPSKAIVAALRGMKQRGEKMQVLENAEFPVLFILGKKDPRIPYKEVLDQVAGTNHAELLLLSDVGHMGFVEAAEICRKSIRSFADRIFN